MEYIEWKDKKYQEIPEQDRPQKGECFICLTANSDDPFNDWDYCVGIVNVDGRARPVGLFKEICFARQFAMNIK